MIKFTHIENLHTAARYAKEFIAGEVKFRGTVKLHGTNSSVACTPDGLQAQSRNRKITSNDDNAGFATFVERKEMRKLIREMETVIRKQFKVTQDTPVTIYGEWIGPGIQNGVAITKLQERHWVLFAAKAGTGDDSKYLDLMEVRELHEMIWETEEKVYTVFEVGTYSNTIDFGLGASVEQAIEHMDRLTEAVEEQCPYAKYHDIEGMGEGIVWVPLGKHWGNSDLCFKTKGEKHKQVNKAKRNKPTLDPEVIESVDKFVDYALTENRLNQGIEYLKEMKSPITMQSTGDFLKWIGGDVKRECRLELQDNDLKWTQVAKAVNMKARDFFVEKTRQAFKEGWIDEIVSK